MSNTPGHDTEFTAAAVMQREGAPACYVWESSDMTGLRHG